MSNPVWFDESLYLSSKLQQLKDTNTAGNINTEIDLLNVIVNAGFTPYTHYVKFGEMEGISPNKYFSPILYARTLAETWNTAKYEGQTVWNELDVLNLAQKSSNPIYMHYQLFGNAAFLNPSNQFDTSAYLQAKSLQSGLPVSDLLKVFLNTGYDPVSHYLQFGQYENLQARPVSPDEAVNNLNQWNPLPQDPLFTQQWHLNNTGKNNGKAGVDINVTDTWKDYTGNGILIAICDDGVQLKHPDLAAHIDTANSFGPNNTSGDPLIASDNHGTSVAGVAGASSNNIGGVGVAYNATLAATSSTLYKRVFTSNTYDIINNSWGNPLSYISYDSIAEYKSDNQEIITAVTTGRNGLGTIITVATGNDAAIQANGNLDSLVCNPYSIAVAAINDRGEPSYYSTLYSGNIVAAPSSGGRVNQNITTTDRTGLDGYNKAPSPQGDYNYNFSGTSSACPTVSGVVALILEANPNLGYRDVREILALSANHTLLDLPDTITNTASNWNGGGMVHSNNVGFGLVDAHAATRLAETWTQQATQRNMLTATGGANFVESNPSDLESVSSSITITDNIQAEYAVVWVKMGHNQASDMQLFLTSPNGTKVTLLSQALPNEQETYVNGYLPFVAAGFMGELTQGDWTLTALDNVSNGLTPLLSSWNIELGGKSVTTNNTYFYTDDYALMANLNPARTVLNDTTGIDTLNFSALSSYIVADMRTLTEGGTGMKLLNTELSLGSSVIENLYGTDFNDVVFTNSVNNYINTGRGDDLIAIKGGGINYIDCGTGYNIVVMPGKSTEYIINQTNEGIIVFNTVTSNTITNASQIIFNDQVLVTDYLMTPVQVYA